MTDTPPTPPGNNNQPEPPAGAPDAQSAAPAQAALPVPPSPSVPQQQNPPVAPFVPPAAAPPAPQPPQYAPPAAAPYGQPGAGAQPAAAPYGQRAPLPPQYGQQPQYGQPPQYGQQPQPGEYPPPPAAQYPQASGGYGQAAPPPPPGAYGYPSAPPPQGPYGAPARPAPGTPVPLDAPYYGASLPIAFSRFWKKYAIFSGRASRSEYWYWYLCNGIAWVIIGILAVVLAAVGATVNDDGTGAPGPAFFIAIVLGICWYLATIVPNIAVAWRRLHDANLAGPFWFLTFVPSVGGIILIVLTVLSSNPAGARFDRQPVGAPPVGSWGQPGVR